MKCPHCGNQSRVTDTRENEGNTIKRRRECLSCKTRFFTVEKVELGSATRLVKHGRPAKRTPPIVTPKPEPVHPADRDKKRRQARELFLKLKAQINP